MCGIWALCFGSPNELDYNSFKKLEHRGPDDSTWIALNNFDIHFGFHRLSINDISEGGRQPFVEQDERYYQSWITNGEIYNANSIQSKILNHKWKGRSDCEVIGPWLFSHLQKFEESGKLDIRKMMDVFDGVYAGIYYVWEYYTNRGYLIVFRDPIGVRPLFWGLSPEGKLYFASEAKSIPLNPSHIYPFPQGSVWICPMGKGKHEYALPPANKPVEYPAMFPPKSNSVGYYWAHPIDNPPKELNHTKTQLVYLLENAVEKRLLSDRPIASLLSGGLDSSLISAIAAKLLHKKGIKLPTFSIGFENAPDLIAARKVAEHIQSDHHEIIITPEQALEAIPEVVKSLETWDPTTIRASTGMYLAAQYIRKNTPYVVVLSGEGADELFEGYLYFHRAPNATEGNLEARRLVEELPWFDVLRADRTTAAHGLELRVPFLDKEFVRHVMHLPEEYKSPKIYHVEKGYLRSAFDELRNDLLPQEILWRKKEAFSDGISVPQKSWFQIIQEYASKQYIDSNLLPIRFHYQEKYFTEKEIQEEIHRQELAADTVEARWFRTLFENHYAFGNHWIPHIWLPRWSKTIDPSARTLGQNENINK